MTDTAERPDIITWDDEPNEGNRRPSSADLPLGELGARWTAWAVAHLESIITVTLVAAATLLMIKTVQPSQVFANTTPTGGDMGAHVWAPAYLRDELLPKWRLSGWAPSWYAGFPAYQFYMVIPPLVIVILNLVLPYGVAFKLVSIAGVVTLPLAAYTFGRLARFRFPIPPLLAIATLPFLFDTGFAIYGGNIASTMAGEFNYSCALSLCLVYLGLLVRLCAERRGRVITAIVLALCVMSHLLVGIFAVVATVAILGTYAVGNWKLLRFVAPTHIGALLVTGVWSWPFWANRHHTIDMGWGKKTDYWKELLAPRMLWVVVLVVFAVLRLVRTRERPLTGLVGATVLMMLVVRYLPEGRLWNARLLSFVWLGQYLLAVFGLLELGHLLGQHWTKATRTIVTRAATPAVALAAVVFVALPTNLLPGSSKTNGQTQWLGLSMRDSYLPGWIHQNYAGYERTSVWAEYKGINDTMGRLGRERGCGRALWEYDDQRIGSYGTPMALMLLPYWTKGCIDSMEGLYFESSPTTPFHFLMAAEVTQKPSNPVTFPDPGLYRPLDLSHGVEHMQLYGIRYYMAISTEAIAQAAARPELTEVARSGPWVVYELSGSALVTGVDRLPYVESGTDADWKHWRDVGLATWDPIGGHRYYSATNGPKDWPRIAKGADLPDIRIDPAVVTNIDASATDRISFTVDQIGKPVLVKINYFPNWKAHGADGPYRVTPNLMMVVPTSKQVSLSYTRSAADWFGIALTITGIAWLVALAFWSRRQERNASPAH